MKIQNIPSANTIQKSNESINNIKKNNNNVSENIKNEKLQEYNAVDKSFGTYNISKTSFGASPLTFAQKLLMREKDILSKNNIKAEIEMSKMRLEKVNNWNEKKEYENADSLAKKFATTSMNREKLSHGFLWNIFNKGLQVYKREYKFLMKTNFFDNKEMVELYKKESSLYKNILEYGTKGEDIKQNRIKEIEKELKEQENKK